MIEFPAKRMRRLRKNEKIRTMVRETVLAKNDFIFPVFIKDGIKKKEKIEAMPGQFRLPLEEVRDEALELVSLGIPAVILFGIPVRKDNAASGAYSQQGV